MKNPSSDFIDALSSARDEGIRPRKFVWFLLVDGYSAGFWTGDEDITTNVTDGDGNVVSRTYFGNGELKSVSPLVYVSDLSIQPATITLSRIAPNAQSVVYGHDPRLASVEVHDALAANARALRADPELAWWGIIDKAPVTTQGVGQESSVALSVVPAVIRLLTKTNSAKRSYESHKQRRGDDLYLYSNAAITWQRFWGEAKQASAK